LNFIGDIYFLDVLDVACNVSTVSNHVNPVILSKFFSVSFRVLLWFCFFDTDIFRQAQRGKVLEKLVFLEGCYLVSVDGTQYFSSKKVYCKSCLEKTNSKTDEVTYSHPCPCLPVGMVSADRRC